MEEKVVETQTPKRTARRSATPKVAPKRTRTVKRTTSVASPVRKAPLRVAAVTTPQLQSKAQGARRIKVFGIGIFLFCVLFGVSALIGLSDKGQLDVSSKIAERKANASEEEKIQLENVPTEQQTPSSPNGGLVGMGAPEPVPVVPEVTASSTTESASSTPETTGEEGSATEAPETVAEPAPSEPQASEQTDAGTVGA